MAVNVKVLFFGATAGIVGQRGLEIALPDNAASQQCFDMVLEDHPALKRHKLLFSRNQQYATGKEILDNGDELAIFTAVSGG